MIAAGWRRILRWSTPRMAVRRKFDWLRLGRVLARKWAEAEPHRCSGLLASRLLLVGWFSVPIVGAS